MEGSGCRARERGEKKGMFIRGGDGCRLKCLKREVVRGIEAARVRILNNKVDAGVA